MKVQRLLFDQESTAFDMKRNNGQNATSHTGSKLNIPMEYMGFRTRKAKIRPDKQNNAKSLFLLVFV
ncbi:hypothetical protein MZJ31_004156 [Vibrio parahaemolyticus]|uniref:hypothetical protein n=1 Tax=Vibrio parahaemolyticus TaxID=670 RepID=UPI0011318568|nr:hypothetical protein [Vibrio parahaemolyticus]EGQ9864389.1 hypothetical protein [Vibrio parahaemolyticus]EHY8552545.1 hypothetical protein [Vibrio parahaemolyticus]EIA9326036.1 hypothetical protein [Vibrio parahaemolyticus]EIR5663360.1 hypothetical protein [Vibrio parahaemolyticus]EJC7104516.1 hypothetical protein [Vibrio parahaemolyticus]